MADAPADRVPDPDPTPNSRRGLVARLEQRDPELRATKRSVRAAVLVPAVFAIAVEATHNGQTPFFTVFGAVALLLFADFGGPRRRRALAFAGLAATGVVCILLGTACSTHAAAAVVSMAVVGFVILFAGVVSPQAVAGSTAALLTFMLAVAVPAPTSAAGDRILGWVLAVVVCVPAALWIWGVRWHDRLRETLAVSSNAVADLIAAHADAVPGPLGDPGPARAAATALATMRTRYEATSYRPTGAGPTDVALTTLVSRLEWAGDRAAAAAALMPTPADAPTVRAVERAAADVLRAVAGQLAPGPRSGSNANGLRLSAAVVKLDEARTVASDRAVADALTDGDTGPAPPTGADPTSYPSGPAVRLADVDPTYPIRMLAFATAMCADVADRAVGDRGAGGRRSRWSATIRSSVSLARGAFSLRSVWLRNSFRGAIGLALAVAVVEVTSVRHGFWVVLGALSVLRSNALGTGTTAFRAVVGTAVGVVFGSLILVAVGGHDDRLWIVLPFAVLVAGVLPSLISFAAGQAGFTVMAVLVVTIVSPVGSSVSVVRIEDVAIGAAVSVVVGLLFWPRGASAELAFAMAQAYSSATSWMLDAIESVGGQAGPTVAGAETLARTAAVRSAHRLDDAYRQYLSERGSKQVPLPVLSELLTGCVRIRLTAVTLESLPKPATSGPSAPLPTVVVARDAVKGAASELDEWFGSFVVSIGHRHVEVPPVPPVTPDQVPDELADAWEAVCRAGRQDGVYAVLRLLWVEQRLDDMRRLQSGLVLIASSPGARGRLTRGGGHNSRRMASRGP